MIRKRQQIDGLNELPKEKRPPDLMIWDGTGNELESWLNEVLGNKKQTTTDIIIGNVEG